jgi:hypothetical protein
VALVNKIVQNRPQVLDRTQNLDRVIERARVYGEPPIEVGKAHNESRVVHPGVLELEDTWGAPASRSQQAAQIRLCCWAPPM